MGAGGFSIVVVGDDGIATVALPERGRVVIGRGPECDVHVEDRTVSRTHAVLHVADELRLEDLRSANGTRVCGMPVLAEAPETFYPDDAIELGEALLFVQYRTIAPKLHRICAPVVFEARTTLERGRARSDGVPVVATIEIDEGPLHPRAVELLVRSELLPGELVTAHERGRYGVLLLEEDVEHAERRAGRIVATLLDRGARLRSHALRGISIEPGAPTQPARALAVAPAGAALHDEEMLHVLAAIERIEPGRHVVLVGHAGSGKSVVADVLHQLSPSRERPMVRLDGSALAEPLPACFERARGTSMLFGDLGATPLALQRALLDLAADTQDVRLVCFAHEPLDELVTMGRVVPDLVERLDAVTILVPPGRTRLKLDGEMSTERERLEKAIAANFGNLRRTADDLGISRSALVLRLERAGLFARA